MRRSAGRPQSEIRTSEDLTTAPAWDILYGDGTVIGAAQNGIHARGTRNAHAAKPRTKHREPSPVLHIIREGMIFLKDRFNRDEMFYRLANYDLKTEPNEKIIEDLKKVSDPNFQDRQGTSYLHIACQGHYLDAIEALLDMGANPNINNKRGLSPIMSAIGRINERNPMILELMLKHGLDLEKKEGDSTLIDVIKSFRREEYNRIIEKYVNTGDG